MATSFTTKARFVALLVFLAAVALPVAAQQGEDVAGFIYGQIKTHSGATYEGLIRWGDQEAFWGDHFNSTKDELPYWRDIPRRERRVPVEVFGMRIGVRGEWDGEGRQLVVRFGDIEQIEVLRGERAELTLRSGSVIEADGGSNDLGATLMVHDRSRGVVELPWRKVDTVRFMAAPAGTEAYDRRLFGTVETTEGSFEGFIQWDSDECLLSDELDGETDDAELSLPFARIRSIERAGRSRARVTLVSGETEVMSGSNDVDSSIRGIWVENSQLGRVQISWDAFRKVDFKPAPSSGPGYDSFAKPRELRGSVRDVSGKTHKGRLVFDADEAETWEMLDGTAGGIEYSIPFAMVAAVEPQGRHGSRVTLRNGTELRLEDSHDVSEENSGVLVIAGPETKPHYVPWDEVDRIELE